MENRKHSIGERIAKARKDAGLTQEELAAQLGITFQAVSLWERDKTAPDTYNLIDLAKILGVSVSSLVEDRGGHVFEVRDSLFDYTHMTSFIRHNARASGMENTLKALDTAIRAHEGQFRKKSEIPYIYHPLNVACHLFAMGVKDDEVIAAALLHDVVEDTDYGYDDLPVSDRCKAIVKLLTKEEGYDEKRYYEGISKNSDAALIKCADRCSNITTMSWGFDRGHIYEYIRVTEKYILPLLKTVKDDLKYNSCAWLLQYQMESMLDIYKRLL